MASKLVVPVPVPIEAAAERVPLLSRQTVHLQTGAYNNLSSHSSGPIQEWLAAHPRVHIEPTPKGACWLNLIEGWWRIFRRNAFAGQSFADHTEIETATTIATRQLNHRAKPWVWGRPPRPHRQLRRRFVYSL